MTTTAPPPPADPSLLPAAPRRHRIGDKTLAAAVVIGVGAAVVIGIHGTSTSLTGAAQSDPTATWQAFGSLVLMDNDVYATVGSSCEGQGGYSDIHAGAGVTVYDADGTIVGSSALENGTMQTQGCVFPYSVDVPFRPIYQYEISHRGRLTEDLDSARHGLMASLGN